MARPTSRDDLLTAAGSEFDRLFDAVASVDRVDRERPGACEHWSVKDLLAHLDAWHELFLGWERVGRTGEKPSIPAPGIGWSETPALNDEIYRNAADDDWTDIEQRLRSSHRAITELIASYSNDDLFTKKRYKWTGSTSVGSYAVSATSSHYAWASKLIRRWAKANAKG